jgi:hypothetical protein
LAHNSSAETAYAVATLTKQNIIHDIFSNLFFISSPSYPLLPDLQLKRKQQKEEVKH